MPQVLLSCTVLFLCGILAGQHRLERYKAEHEQAQQHSRSARRSTRTRRISNAVVLGEALLFSAMSASIGARRPAQSASHCFCSSRQLSAVREAAFG